MGSPESRATREVESMRKNGSRCRFSAAGRPKQIARVSMAGFKGTEGLNFNPSVPFFCFSVPATILKPLLSGARLPKLTGAGSPNTAPNRRLVSGGRCNDTKDKSGI